MLLQLLFLCSYFPEMHNFNSVISSMWRSDLHSCVANGKVLALSGWSDSKIWKACCIDLAADFGITWDVVSLEPDVSSLFHVPPWQLITGETSQKHQNWEVGMAMEPIENWISSDIALLIFHCVPSAHPDSINYFLLQAAITSEPVNYRLSLPIQKEVKTRFR